MNMVISIGREYGSGGRAIDLCINSSGLAINEAADITLTCTEKKNRNGGHHFGKAE